MPKSRDYKYNWPKAFMMQIIITCSIWLHFELIWLISGNCKASVRKIYKNYIIINMEGRECLVTWTARNIKGQRLSCCQNRWEIVTRPWAKPSSLQLPGSTDVGSSRLNNIKWPECYLGHIKQLEAGRPRRAQRNHCPNSSMINMKNSLQILGSARVRVW